MSKDEEYTHEWMNSYRKLTDIHLSCLKFIGLGEIDSTLLANAAYFAYKIWIVSAMYIFAITLFLDIYENIDNMSIATDDGCIFAGIFVVIFKAINYLVRYKGIVQLQRKILKCANDLCEFSEVEHIKDIIRMYQVRNSVLFYGFVVLGCILCTALLFFSPMQNGLPIRAKYPFNTTITPWRQVGLTIETFGIAGGIFAIIAMDGAMVTMCNLITALFDIVNVNFQNCTREGRTEENMDKISSERTSTSALYRRKNIFLIRYKTCLQFHQRLVTMAGDYNRNFSSSMFVQMLSSTSIICLTGFQAVVVGGQSSDVVKFGIYLSAAISQLLYICWIGNQLSYMSSILDRSQWLSGWHHENLRKIVQTFTLSTIFSRQPITLRAGVFYVLSLETFIAIVKRSYSVFTLLNNMHTTDV